VIKELPLFAHTLRKTLALCGSVVLPIDQLYATLSFLRHSSPAAIRIHILPRIYNLLSLPPPSPTFPPPSLPLSASAVNKSGVYLCDFGFEFSLLFVGSAAPVQFVSHVLGADSVAGMDTHRTTFPLPTVQSPPAMAVYNFVTSLQSQYERPPPLIYITSEGRLLDYLYGSLCLDHHMERGEAMSVFSALLEKGVAEKESSGLWW